MKKILFILGFSLLFFPAFSQNANTLQLEEGMSSPPANLLDYDWIAGSWKGKAFGGTVEEVWTHASGGSMMGSFKLVVNGEVGFYELMTLTQEGETIHMRLKHFHGNLKGWEEKDETVDFPLVKAEKDKLYFSGLTFEKISDKEINVYVLIGGDDGAEEAKFSYTKE
ncbi:MAG: DUF6265 family protein [Bacteroidia bacterium]|nr:DUF6265 family protein [Bacteroidia bacterium]